MQNDDLKHLSIIFFLALLIRVALLVALLLYGGEETLILGDTERYLGLAQSVLVGEGYTYENEGLPEAYRPPGYPGYLLVFEALNLPFWLASLIQIFVSSLIPVILVALARSYSSVPRRVIFWSGVAASLEPVQVFYSVMLLPDVFSTILLYGAMFGLFVWMQNGKLFPLGAGGLMIGILNYFRPVGLYLPIALTVALALYYLLISHFSKKRLVALMLFVLVSLLPLVPWQIRNSVHFGSFEFTSSLPVNLYEYGAGFIESVVNGESFADARVRLRTYSDQYAPDSENFKSLHNKDFHSKYAFDKIVEYPVVYLKGYLLGVNTFLFSGNYHYLLARYDLIDFPPRVVSFSHVLASGGAEVFIDTVRAYLKYPYTLLALGGKFLWIIVVFGALTGMWAYRKDLLSFVSFALFLYFVATIASVVIGVEARHRYALNPLLILYFFASIQILYAKTISHYSSSQRER